MPRRLIAVLGIVAAVGASFAAGMRFGGSSTNDASTEVLTISVPAPVGQAATIATPTAPVEKQIRTLRDILQLRGDFAQTAALYALCMRQDQRGIERLFEEIPTVPTERDRRAATGILYSRLAELNPEAAVVRVMGAPESDMSALGTVFGTWALLDMKPALARAAKLEEPSRSYAIRAIIGAREDLPRAERESIAAKLNVRMNVGEPQPRLDLRTAASSERAWRAALSNTNSEQRYQQLYRIMTAWARQAPEAAMQAVEGLDDLQLRQQLSYQAMMSWAETAPEQALDWVLAQRPSPSRGQMLAAVSAIVARDKPQLMLDIVNKLPPAERQRVMPQIIGNLAATDMQAAIDLLPTLKDSNSRWSALMSISSRYASRDVDAALRWANSLPASDSRMVIPQVISQLASADPSRAAGAINSLRDAEVRETAMTTLASTWAQRDPQAAFAWAQQLPAGRARSNAVTNIFQQWAAYEPQAVVQQLSQLTDDSLRDAAALALVSSQYAEPEVVEQAYRRIQNKDMQRQAAMQLYMRLRESDPERAQRLLQEAGYAQSQFQRQ